MAKQSILGRMSQLVRANVNTMLDRAEDPEKMLDQMVRDFSSNISEAQDAVAQTIGNLRMLEDDYQEDVKSSQEWSTKSIAASRRADEFRNAGKHEDAERFDNLAKIAIQRQMESESSAKSIEGTLDMQRQSVDQLKTGLEQMQVKRQQLVEKQHQLVARQKVAQTQSQVQSSIQQLSSLDPTSELGRYEESVRQMEAKTRGQQELAASSLENQFEQLTDMGEQTEVEARLAALKSGGNMYPTAITSGKKDDEYDEYDEEI